ncbi:hypothetical protein SAMN05877842_102140 [Ureibacillus acetophenoni]|uniref:Uncharacterized protein n=1 Tax=Ureibacillus acetophenoni TaxID=614649 RepID=A0A285U422_9BACL|nr:hypothetical protein SAMN05877842_102140 [Ureibacillus acetophenoni]
MKVKFQDVSFLLRKREQIQYRKKESLVSYQTLSKIIHGVILLQFLDFSQLREVS